MIEENLDHILLILVLVDENNDAHTTRDEMTILFLRQLDSAMLGASLELNDAHMSPSASDNATMPAYKQA
ncbi:MAG: hypothetical protein ACPL89_10955 [Roseiflexus castenholzii]